MKTQKEIWQDEHIKQATFNRMHSNRPSSPVKILVGFLKGRGYLPSQTYILDLGCGKGRNSIYLASEGFKGLGVDFVKEAIREARKRRSNRLQKNLQFEVLDLTGEWPYSDSSFDAIIDCNVTTCIPSPGRERAIAEAYRVLNPGGYYLFYGTASREPLVQLQGPEPNSVIFPDSGKFEKQYTREELLNTYVNFKFIKLDTKAGGDLIGGKETAYSMWVGLFQKVAKVRRGVA